MSKLSTRLVCAVLVLPLSAWLLTAVFAPSARAQDPKPAPEAKGDPKAKGEQGEGQRPGPRGEGRWGRRGGEGEGPGLHGAMEQMKGELRKVSEAIADPARNEDTLRGLGRMISFAGASQGGLPKSVQELPADKQAAEKLAFRRELVLLARNLADIEMLVLDGKNAEAAAALKTKVVDARDAAHTKYGVDEE
jgi:hypothetical protein